MNSFPRITPILQQMVLNAPNGLPAKAVAGLVGKEYPTLLAEVGERGGHKAGVELILPLMCVTNCDIPLDVMAEARGGFFVRMPESPNEEHAVHQQCMEAVRDFGDLMQTVARALEDGTITQEERKEIAVSGYRASACILTLLRVVEANTQGST